MNTFLRSEIFDIWLTKLKDKVGRACISIASVLPNRAISVIVSQLARESLKCVYMWVRLPDLFHPAWEENLSALLGGDKSSQRR